MNPRIKKELHPLLLPWITAVAGAVVVLLFGRESEINAGQFVTFLGGLGAYAFLGGAALMGSSVFGVELQQRTLPLLFSQPSERARIWREKMLVSGVAIVTVALVGAGVLAVLSLVQPHPRPPFAPRDMAFISLFLLATACSCGFWTLGAGSTLGGVAFTVAAQFAAGLGGIFVASRIRGRDLEEGEALPVLAVTALVYSAAFLWFGRRKFLHLELKSARFGDGVPASAKWFLNAPKILTSRSQGRGLNLVRKELRLQKPIVQLAAVFVVCWLATFLFQWFRPRQNVIYLFDVLTCIYAPLGCLLAGCVSLGEEKALGLITAQLTLPYSRALQWLIKLAACAGTAAVLCLGLPLFLFWLTGYLIDVSDTGLMNPHDNGLLALSCICGVVFLLGFWAISMFANTVRAALVAVFGLLVVGGCIALGAWCGRQENRFELAPLVALMCHLQMPPEDFRAAAIRAVRVLAYGSIVGITLLAILQSLLRFGNVQAPPGKILAYSLSLAALVAGLSFWSIDFSNSVSNVADSGPVQELRAGLNRIAARQATVAPGKTHQVSPEALGRLSPLTEIWLHNAAISYRFLPPTIFKNGDVQSNYQATVAFPSGRTFEFGGGYSANHFLRRYGL